MDAYGGRCACCGEDQMEFLSIDHIFNDGGKLRREGKEATGRRFYKQLKDQGFPQGRLQVLCHNCNGAKGYYGICPHEIISKNLLGIAVDMPRLTRPRLVV
jgi:hypothetical protein